MSELDELASAVKSVAQAPPTVRRRNRVGTAASSLFGAAAIQATVGLLYWFAFAPRLGSVEWYVCFGFVIFVILGIIALSTPVFGASAGLAVYSGYLTWQALMRPELVTEGLIFKVPVLLLLLLSIVLAFRSVR
jgi:hypothetical protein